MSVEEANTRLDNPVSRRNGQRVSTGFNSGARAGRSPSGRVSGPTSSVAPCRRARSLVVRGAGPGSPSRPAARDLVLVAPARLVLPPQLSRGAFREARPDRLSTGGEAFGKAPQASGV